MKTILITGGSGYLGRALAKRFRGNHRVIIVSRNQKALLSAGEECKVETAPLDVTDFQACLELMKRFQPEIVIHAAATKFVDISEKYPNECIDVNINGSKNIATAAAMTGVEHVIGISTDKAAAPIANLYGLSKAVMEKTFITLNKYHETDFSLVRYGNVVWSTGSVFPIWKRMLEENERIITTGPELSRFFFKVTDAVELINSAMENKSLTAGNILSIPMKGVQMKRILEVWTSEVGKSWEVGEFRQGDREEEFLIAENELSLTRNVSIEGKNHYLIAGNPTSVYSELREPVSSSRSEQLSDEEIFALIFNSAPEVL